MIDKAAVYKAMTGRSFRYQTQSGRIVIGDRVSAIPGILRDAGFKRVSRDYQDPHDLARLGLEIVQAQYISGAHPTGRFVDVVVLREPTS